MYVCFFFYFTGPNESRQSLEVTYASPKTDTCARGKFRGKREEKVSRLSAMCACVYTGTDLYKYKKYNLSVKRSARYSLFSNLTIIELASFDFISLDFTLALVTTKKINAKRSLFSIRLISSIQVKSVIEKNF